MNSRISTILICVLILLPLCGYAEAAVQIYSPLRDIEVSGSIAGNRAKAVVKNNGILSRNIKLTMRAGDTAVSSVSKILAPNEEKTYSIYMPEAISGASLYISADYGKAAKEIYVAKYGNDSNDGSFSSPFATVDRARKEILKIKYSKGLQTGGITVYIREGEYYFDKTLYFNNVDSGYENAPVTYTAYNGENVSFKGSKTIQNETFVNAGLSNPNILKANLRASGIYNFGSIALINSFNIDSSIPSSTMLYESGEPQVIARYPNKSNDPELSNLKIGIVSSERKFEHNLSFNPAVKWANEGEIYARGFFKFYWYEDAKRVDADSDYVTLRETTAFGVDEGQEYYF